MASNIETAYNACLAKIYNWAMFRNKEQQARDEIDLKQMKDLMSYFGNPHMGNFKIIHVAGTNGKGSVTLKTARALQHLGFKVGMFTSPHIASFRERIQINGELVSMEEIVEYFTEVENAADLQKFDIRFFEVITAMGFLAFRKHQCDFVVLECGIGARIDSTNIVGFPDVICSTITSIGLDHQEILGPTHEDIGREKSFIIKRNVPCVLGPSCKSIQAIRDRIREEDAESYFIDSENSFVEENSGISKKIVELVARNLGIDYDI